jgi:hypothetical protein
MLFVQSLERTDYMRIEPPPLLMAKPVVVVLLCVGLLLMPAVAADGVLRGTFDPAGSMGRPTGSSPEESLPVVWDAGKDSHSVIAATYEVEIEWIEGMRDIGDPLVEGVITLGDRTGRFEQTAWIGTSFGLFTPWTHFMHLNTTTGETDGVPWLRLEFGVLPAEDGPEGQRGFVEFHFRDDHVLHHHGLAWPAAVYVPNQRSTTLLEWDDPFQAHGSIDANGAVHPGDDGSALDDYQGWQDHFRYSLYQDDGAQLVGHARIAQGHYANFASTSGSFEVNAFQTHVTTNFHASADVDGEDQWVTDAWLFPAPGVDTETLAESLFALPLPGGWVDPGPGGPGQEQPEWATPPGPEVDPTAHPVVVAVPDSGINPYHEFFHRPGLTEHPCTYIQDFPCDIPALELSIGVHDTYEAAYQADRHIWESIQPGDWYWIPGTVFVAVHCVGPYSSATFESRHCILDDHGHGTGTTSNVLTENPAALIAAMGGFPRTERYFERGIPVDVMSVSWGNVVPVPGHAEVLCANHENAPIYVTGTGNDPRITWLDCAKSDPGVITVGGAYAEDQSEETLAAKQPDVVSYYCRPSATPDSLYGWRQSYCGTSFSGPTVAGALSKVIQAVRSQSGYQGTLQGGYIDPVAGITINDLRDAMNRTASYDPEPRYDNTRLGSVPLNPVAPWVQWGWGFYDGFIADATIDHLLGTNETPEKPVIAREYMEAIHEFRKIQHTHIADADIWPLQQNDAGSGQDAPNHPSPEVWIESGVVYHGTLVGVQETDYYAFWAEEGDLVEAKGRGTFNRFAIKDHEGVLIDSTVSTIGLDVVSPTSFTIVAEYTGIHYFHFRGFHPIEYAFSIGINEPAPEPGLAGFPVPPLVPQPGT